MRIAYAVIALMRHVDEPAGINEWLSHDERICF